MNPDNPNFRDLDKKDEESKPSQEKEILLVRDPLSREKKLAAAMLKKVDAYIKKNGLNDKTLVELEGVFRHLIDEFQKHVALNNYRKKT